MNTHIEKYQTHIIEILNNIKYDITYHEVVFLLSYKNTPSESRDHFKSQILSYFGWTAEQFNKINCIYLSKIYEYLAAIELSMKFNIEFHCIEHLTTDFKDSLKIPPYDIGLDLISVNKKFSGQVKHRVIGSTIEFHEIKKSDWCNMHSNRATSNNMELLFVTPKNVKLSNYMDSYYKYNHHILSNERVLELMGSISKFVTSVTVNGVVIPINKNIELSPKYIEPNSWIANRNGDFNVRHCQQLAYGLIINTIINNFKLPELPNNNEEDNTPNSNSESLNIKMICGSGKTDVIACVVNYILQLNKTVLILVPRIILLEQTNECFKSWQINAALIGSGFDTYPTNVTICVYNSIDKVKDFKWDYIIIDEAHHIESRKSLYDDEPKYLDTILLLTQQINTIKFSASLINGHYEYNLRQAIDEKVLVDYQLHIPYYKNSTYDEAIINYLNMHPEYTSVIGFCNNVENCKKYKSLLLSHNYKAEIITGNSTAKERNQMLADFKEGKFQILLSVYVLSEGINLPFVNTVMFLDNRKSKINVLQCMLRCLRLHKQKTIGHIVLPCVDELKTNGSKMMKIIHQIASNDQKLNNIFKTDNISHMLQIEKVKNEIVDVSQIDDTEYNNIKELYEVIYNSQLNMVNGHGDIIKCLKIYKEYHDEVGRMIKNRDTVIFKNVYISGGVLSKIRYNLKSHMYDLILDKINAIYPELYQWYLKNKDKVSTPFDVKIYAFKYFYDKYGREMVQEDPSFKFCYNGIEYTISGKMSNHARQHLKNGRFHEHLELVRTVYPPLYKWWLENRTNKKEEIKERISLHIKLLGFKDYHDKYGHGLTSAKAVHIFNYLNTDYEIKGQALYDLIRKSIPDNSLSAKDMELVYAIYPYAFKLAIDRMTLPVILKGFVDFQNVNKRPIIFTDRHKVGNGNYDVKGKPYEVNGMHLKYLMEYRNKLTVDEINMIRGIYPSILN